MPPVWRCHAIPCVVATLAILSQLLIAQDDRTVQNEGQIIGTTVNDQGEPIANARLCTSVVKSNSSTTNCGPQSDEHGKFDIHVPLETNRIYGRKLKGAIATTPRCMTAICRTRAYKLP